MQFFKKIRRAVKRKSAKLQSKLRAKEVMITTGKGGLTKSEIKDVLATLKEAKSFGKIPSLSYEYRPTTIIDRREPIFLIPKNVPIQTARTQVKSIMREKYGTKYIVT